MESTVHADEYTAGFCNGNQLRSSCNANHQTNRENYPKPQMLLLDMGSSNRMIFQFASHFLQVCISVSDITEMIKDEKRPNYPQNRNKDRSQSDTKVQITTGLQYTNAIAEGGCKAGSVVADLHRWWRNGKVVASVKALIAWCIGRLSDESLIYELCDNFLHSFMQIVPLGTFLYIVAFFLFYCLDGTITAKMTV